MTAPYDTQPTAARVIRFGPFSLYPVERLLLEDAARVRVGGRALEILLLLIEKAGDLVSHHEILRRVWPRRIVVDGNLRVHVSALRKALGDGRNGRRFIINLSGQGYCFVAPIRQDVEAVPAAPQVWPALARGIPTPTHSVIGRDTAVQSLSAALQRRRLVSLVGAGGVGKTSVALAAVLQLNEAEDTVPWRKTAFVDLACAPDGLAACRALATGLGAQADRPATVAAMLEALGNESVLIILDGCEHVIKDMAAATECILRSAPGSRVLCTSREPMRVQGEWIQRLRPLSSPTRIAGLSLHDAFQFPAVELFTRRAALSAPGFTLSDADVSAVVEICRRLDGLPLAINLAAARLDDRGVSSLAASLDDCLSVLVGSRAGDTSRHRSMRASLDWSFSLLSAREQDALMRVSVFQGGFTLGSVNALMIEADHAADDIFSAMSELVAKSLVTTDISGDEVFFQLPNTTRAYALDRLRRSDAAREPALRARHAQHMLALMD